MLNLFTTLRCWKARRSRIRVIRLASFTNEKDYIAYLVHPLKQPRNLPVVLFWKKGEYSGRMVLQHPFIGIDSLEETNQIVVCTFHSVLWGGIASARKNRIDLPDDFLFHVSFFSPGRKQVWLGGLQCGTEPTYVFAFVDLGTKEIRTVPLPEWPFGLFESETGRPQVITRTSLYTYEGGCFRLQEKHGKDNLLYVGQRPNRHFIFGRKAGEEFYLLEWPEGQIRSGICWRDLCLSRDTIWLLFQKEVPSLECYTSQGSRMTQVRLKEMPISLGPRPQGGVWLFYPDYSIEVYEPDGKVKKYEPFLEKSIREIL